MFKLRENSLLFELTHNIAFFLAGAFAIHTVPPTYSEFHRIDYFILVVGWILIITAFLSVFATLPYKHLERVKKSVYPFISGWTYPILYAVTLSEVFITMLNPFDMWLFIVGIVLLVLLSISIFANPMPGYESDINRLLVLDIMFLLTTIVLLFIQAGCLDIIIVFALFVITFILIVIRFVLLMQKWPQYKPLNTLLQ